MKKIKGRPFIVQIKWDRVGRNGGFGYIDVFMEVSTHKGYLPTINMGLHGSAFRVYMNISGELKLKLQMEWVDEWDEGEERTKSK